MRGLVSWARLVPAFLTRVAQVNDCSRSPALVPFVVGGERVGAVPPVVVEALRSWPAVFDFSDPSCVALSPELAEATLEQRSAAVHEVALKLRERGMITKWRDETLALVTSFDALPALLVERRLVPLLGGKGYGVAVNGYSRDQRGDFLWVATRAADKATWPAMLDTLAAGAMSAGASVVAAARSEAAEEAGVPDELLAVGLKPAGAVSYRGPDEDPILPKDDVFFVFDLELPWDFVPVAVDGEVQRFERMRVADVVLHVAFGESPSFPCLADRGPEYSREQDGRLNAFKPNINLVVLDFLLRHGHIPPTAPRYLELVAALRQGGCR